MDGGTVALKPGVYKTAVLEQRRLLAMLEERPISKPVRFVGGADVSSSMFSKTGFGGIVVLDLENKMKLADSAVVKREIDFPYIPGLLGFREVPVLSAAYGLLKIEPDVMIVDAQGVAHPRGFGAAAHLGVVLGVPTIGCAKSRLCGEYEEPGAEKGSSSPLTLDGKEIGRVLRTKTNVKPLFISRGHLVTLQDCVNVVMSSLTKYRLPEPSRQAHQLVNEFRKRSS
ncbi:MAG TPA: endonuclease V [Acidobacteriota bacterium]|nr:endonuclease V [Acidobacteriota bacterium]